MQPFYKKAQAYKELGLILNKKNRVFYKKMSNLKKILSFLLVGGGIHIW